MGNSYDRHFLIGSRPAHWSVDCRDSVFLFVCAAPHRAPDGIGSLAVSRMAGNPRCYMEHGHTRGERRLPLQPDELGVEPRLSRNEHCLLRPYFRDSSVSICPDPHAFPAAIVMGLGNSPSYITVRYLDLERICGKKRARCGSISPRCKAPEPSNRNQLRAMVARLSHPARESSSSGTCFRSHPSCPPDGPFFRALSSRNSARGWPQPISLP